MQLCLNTREARLTEAEETVPIFPRYKWLFIAPTLYVQIVAANAQSGDTGPVMVITDKL